MVKISVHSQANFEIVMRAVKKKAQTEGIIREARVKKNHEKPCRKRKRKTEESIKRKRRNRVKFNEIDNNKVINALIAFKENEAKELEENQSE